LPELLGNKQPKHEYLYWEYFKYHYGWKPGDEGPRNTFENQAVRMGKWKGIRTNIHQNPQGPVQLFNLDKDWKEEHNVAIEHPEIIKRIKKIIKTAHQDTEYFQAENF